MQFIDSAIPFLREFENITTVMEFSEVGERILNEFLDSDEQLSPEKKAVLDSYLTQLTNHISSLQQNMLMNSTVTERSGKLFRISSNTL